MRQIDLAEMAAVAWVFWLPAVVLANESWLVLPPSLLAVGCTVAAVVQKFVHYWHGVPRTDRPGPLYWVALARVVCVLRALCLLNGVSRSDPNYMFGEARQAWWEVLVLTIPIQFFLAAHVVGYATGREKRLLPVLALLFACVVGLYCAYQAGSMLHNTWHIPQIRRPQAL